jgi:DNA invertase Pin-like site-specific DNA recombinase
MRAIGYVRVSTEEQATGGVSLAAQREKLEAYTKLYELELVAVIDDAGESAKTLNRPGLRRALGMLKSGKADALLICKLDRLTRSVADWQSLIDAFFGERAGKQLMSVTDSIDTRTAAGRLVLNVLLSVAQWEREAIAERTRDALQHKIRRGERCGEVRFGFDLGPDGVTLIPNPAEQEAIAIIQELRAAGQTLRQIATRLAELGVPTKKGNTKWTHTAVARIVNRVA